MEHPDFVELNTTDKLKNSSSRYFRINVVLISQSSSQNFQTHSLTDTDDHTLYIVYTSNIQQIIHYTDAQTVSLVR